MKYHLFFANNLFSLLKSYIFIFRFDILKKLGEGSCGKVQLGICKETEQLVSYTFSSELFEYYYLIKHKSIIKIIRLDRLHICI